MLRRYFSVLLLLLSMLPMVAVAERQAQAEEAEAGKAEAVEVSTALRDYVEQADASFQWKLLSTEKLPLGVAKLHTIELTSQTWQGITWKHVLAVIEPREIRHPNHAVLFITGGRTGGQLKDAEKVAAVHMATAGGLCVGYLLQVPNQPLLGDRFEDDLITDTFLRYLETGDATWPLLFPMVKSAVRAMDTIQGVAEAQWEGSIDKFIVAGASKRGWTTWLTGVVDPRVAAIAPIVIDTLNFQPQMKHQMAVWGKYSEQIRDYTSKGLVQIMEERPEIPLWRWVDPYTYRGQLTMPKLIINGTNDPYWVVDALNLYWDELPGTKHILYVPNAGHGLEGGIPTAINTLVAFATHIANGSPLPQPAWKFNPTADRITLTVESDVPPAEVRLWQATSASGDFRGSQWTSTKVEPQGGRYQVQVAPPDSGHIAVYAEIRYGEEENQFSLSTQIHRQ